MKNLKHLMALSLGVSTLTASLSALAAPYITLQAGTAKGHPINVWMADLKKSAPTGRVGAGIDWGISSRFKLGVEAGVQGYKRRAQSSGPLRVTSKRLSYDGMGVADLYLSERVDVAAKLGVAYVHPKNRLEIAQSNGAVYRTNLHSTSYYVPKAAIGVGYKTSDKVNLNVTLSHELAKNHTIRGVTSVMGGIQYKFC